MLLLVKRAPYLKQVTLSRSHMYVCVCACVCVCRVRMRRVRKNRGGVRRKRGKRWRIYADIGSQSSGFFSSVAYPTLMKAVNITGT